MTTKPRAAVASMAEPIEEDCAHALIVQMYQARELLALAEREADLNEQPNSGAGELHLETALGHLRGAASMALELVTQTRGARKLIDRAVCATEAALAQVRLYDSYSRSKEPTTLEKKQLGHIRNIWRRSAEAAKKEAHRALAELAQRFPDAYDKDDI